MEENELDPVVLCQEAQLNKAIACVVAEIFCPPILPDPEDPPEDPPEE